MDDYVFVTVLITTTTPTTYNFSMPSKSQKNKQTNKSQKKINKQRKQASKKNLVTIVGFYTLSSLFFQMSQQCQNFNFKPPSPTHFSKVFPSHTMVTKRHVPQVFLLPPHRTILILHVSKESGR